MALVGFRGDGGSSHDQSRDENAQESFAPARGVVHELEEAEIQRQLLLRDTAVWPQPGAEQGPRPLYRVDVDLAETVAILIARVLPTSVADRLVLIAPGRQTGVDVVLIGVDTGTLGHGGLDDRLDRLLLHVGQHAQHHLTAALHQAQDRRLVLRQRAAARRTRQPAAASEPAPLAPAAGWPLCPATTYTSSISTSPSSRMGAILATKPRRSCSVMACTSDPSRPSSWAICRFERFRPIKYRQLLALHFPFFRKPVSSTISTASRSAKGSTA